MKHIPHKKVTLEPALELRGVSLWTPAKRRIVAKKLKRWAHQLEFSALLLEAEAAAAGRPPQQRLKFLPPRKLALN